MLCLPIRYEFATHAVKPGASCLIHCSSRQSGCFAPFTVCKRKARQDTHWRQPRGHMRSDRLALRANAQQSDAPPDHRRATAELAVDRYVRSSQVIGIGPGPLTALATEYLARQLGRGSLQDITVVPGGDAAARETAFHELPVADLRQHPQLDIAIMDVDQIDSGELAAIVGVAHAPQQPQLPKSQALAAAAEQLIALVDGQEHIVERLEGNVPVLIDGTNWEDTAEKLDDAFLGDAEVWRRSNVETTQPRALDDPFITMDCNNLLDLKFREPLVEPQVNLPLELMGERVAYSQIVQEIEAVDGVLAHGILLGAVSAALIATDVGPQTLRRATDVAVEDP